MHKGSYGKIIHIGWRDLIYMIRYEKGCLFMKVKAILAQNLKIYRTFFNLSQEEIALQTNMSPRGYGKIERQEVATSLDTLEKLSCGLGVSPEMLLSPHMEYCLRMM